MILFSLRTRILRAHEHHQLCYLDFTPQLYINSDISVMANRALLKWIVDFKDKYQMLWMHLLN